MRFDNLPNWNITSEQPGFYDVESGTVIQMVARLYKRIKELIEDYNNFINEVTNHLDIQDKDIADAIQYMKDNLTETANKILEEMIKNGELLVLLNYNEESESLNLLLSNSESGDLTND